MGDKERNAVRRYLGIDDIFDQLERMERKMATQAKVQLAELKALMKDMLADQDAKLDQLLNAQGEFDPEAQVLFDELKDAVAQADQKLGDADGSETPVVVPETPVDGEPLPDDGSSGEAPLRNF